MNDSKINILKSAAIAFARYSKVPMPHFVWSEADFGASLIFFPWVGVVMGVVFCAIWNTFAWLDAPPAAIAAFLSCAPPLFTGGFHLDGYMDTVDARSSYKSRPEKLAILSDPHVGAFAVIGLFRQGLLFFGSLVAVISASEKAIKGLPFGGISLMLVMVIIFFISRIFSALSVLLIPPAKTDGMLYAEAKSARIFQRAEIIWMGIFLVMGTAAAIAVGGLAGTAVIITCITTFAWFVHMCKREFDGITGDLAGYFVVICEVNATFALAVMLMLCERGWVL